jgi:hypothetical protein
LGAALSLDCKLPVGTHWMGARQFAAKISGNQIISLSVKNICSTKHLKPVCTQSALKQASNFCFRYFLILSSIEAVRKQLPPLHK